jgi:hypothetical protein
MKRVFVLAAISLGVLFLQAAPAFADLTGFLGVSTTPDSRSAKGVAIGISLIVVGFEMEYSKISEEEATGAPGLATGSGNVLIMTPTSKIQLYGTTGAGLFHETYRSVGTTQFATNVGGGAKVAFLGPIRLRLDYRVFHLNGTPVEKRVQRFYAGLSIAF